MLPLIWKVQELLQRAGIPRSGLGHWFCPDVLSGLGGGASAEWLLPGGARRPYVPRASANAPSPAATELSVLGVAGKVFYPR